MQRGEGQYRVGGENKVREVSVCLDLGSLASVLRSGILSY